METSESVATSQVTPVRLTKRHAFTLLYESYEYLLHDRDSIFAQHLDESIARLGVKVLKSPPQSPTANYALG